MLEIAYLEEDTFEWAKASEDDINMKDIVKHRDNFGAVLKQGDNIVLTKTPEVKDATFNTKVSTIVQT